MEFPPGLQNNEEGDHPVNREVAFFTNQNQSAGGTRAFRARQPKSRNSTSQIFGISGIAMHGHGAAAIENVLEFVPLAITINEVL